MARKKIRTPEERRASEDRAQVIDEYLSKLELRIGERRVPYRETTWDERTKMIDDYIAKVTRGIDERNRAEGAGAAPPGG